MQRRGTDKRPPRSPSRKHHHGDRHSPLRLHKENLRTRDWPLLVGRCLPTGSKEISTSTRRSPPPTPNPVSLTGPPRTTNLPKIPPQTHRPTGQTKILALKDRPSYPEQRHLRNNEMA